MHQKKPAGGSTWKEALMHAVTKRRTVYMGNSAGAIVVAGAHIDTAHWKGWDDPSVVPAPTVRERMQG